MSAGGRCLAYLLGGEGLGAEQQVSWIASRLDVFADLPDEVEEGWVGAAAAKTFNSGRWSEALWMINRMGCARMNASATEAIS